jgi:DNA-directed RNA polymerase alpha subunit
MKNPSLAPEQAAESEGLNEIETLCLPARTRNALVRAGFRTCEELRLTTDQELLREPQIGAKGLACIRRAVLKGATPIAPGAAA